jgi:hypothetical protein
MANCVSQEWVIVKNKKCKNKQKIRGRIIFVDNVLMKKIQNWQPPILFNATPFEINCVKEIGIVEKWDKTTFHMYFKSMEKHLLLQFRDYINEHYYSQTHLPDYVNDIWFMKNDIKWKMIALMRDFHDYMCNRDKKHYIRTDDCRRFISCVISGVESGIFPMPVHRLLKGDTAPFKFIHPLFTQFS